MPPVQPDVVSLIRWPLILAGFVILVRVLLPRSSVTPKDLVREMAIVVFAYFCYFSVRAAIEGRQFEAFDRAADIIRLERTLGIFWEVSLQTQTANMHLLVNLANWTYVWGHWPVVIFVATWLFLSHRKEYYLYRNAFLISGAIGLIIFGALPVAPPRFMLAWGFVDTASAYHVGPSTSLLVNEYAAMPSLHFGWNLLVGLAIVRHAEWLPLRVVGAILPPAMFFSIVLTGNHYIIDGMAGGTVALIGLMAAAALRRRLDRDRSDMTQSPSGIPSPA